MGNGIATVEVRVRRDHAYVLGMGRTPRGQRFIRQNIMLATSRIGSKEFKVQMGEAVKEMLAQETLDI